MGNRTASLGVSSYTTNASNELTATSNATYTYDSNGNTLTKTVGSNTTSYTWDFENRLTSVTLPSSGGTVSFKYDPLGRRIEKVSPTLASIFEYDGDNLIETANSSGNAVSRYAQTEDIDEPLAAYISGTTSYYEADGLGSVSSLTSSAGALADTYTYDSFGNLANFAGSVSNPFSYTGREVDSETGLYYYRARYYDPSAGRLTSEDPLLFGGGDPNFYSYVGNDPAYYTDPLGMDRSCLFAWFCGHPSPETPAAKWTPYAFPANSVIVFAPSGLSLIAPPNVDVCKEYKAGLANHRNISAIGPAIGQGGTYDWQRDGAKHIVSSEYEDVANYGVGVYMNGAGYPRWQTIAMGLTYAARNAKNFNLKTIPYWIRWWGKGWDDANAGAFAGCGCK